MQRISEGQQRDLPELLADFVEGELIEVIAIYGASRDNEDDYTIASAMFASEEDAFEFYWNRVYERYPFQDGYEEHYALLDYSYMTRVLHSNKDRF